MKSIELLNPKTFAILFALSAALFSCPTSLAQTNTPAETVKRHEIRGGIGGWSGSDLSDGFDAIVFSGTNAGIYSTVNDRLSGNYNVTYRYALRERFLIGGSFTYGNMRSDLEVDGGGTGNVINNHFTLAPAEAEYRYVNHKKFKLYGFIGIGLLLDSQKLTVDGESEKETNLYLGAQLSPLCMQVGHNAGFNLEFGYGYKGLVHLGFFVKF